MATYKTVIYEVKDQVGWIRFNRPERRNAINTQLLEDSIAALEEAEQDDSVRAVAITGEGSVFCAGLDLRMAAEDTPEQRRRFGKLNFGFRENIRWCKKPVVGRVNGGAYGAGVNMLGAFDITVVLKSSQFAIREVNVGLEAGGTFLFDIGRARAMELTLTGRPFTGEDGERWGMFTRSVADLKEMDKVTQEYLDMLRELPPLGMAANKRMTNLLVDLAGWESLRKVRSDMGAMLSKTEDHKEAARAFAEKRKPVFHGR
ncbi:MAG: enoyl-CoA hydratase/isomerase family protein [Chloroflexi bacterium]|nr:enoyl-CoA hydratase/isomerase family protein [Chloroflexota bacterium]